MSRRDRKKIQSRKAILQAAVKEFKTRGFHDTTVADIMNSADLGVGTFYNYFSSKEEVLSSLLAELVHDSAKSIEEKKKSGAASLELIEMGAKVTAKFLDENRFVLPLFVSASEHAAMGGGEESRKVSAPGFKMMFESIVTEGQAKNEIRSDIPAGIITEMLHSIFQAAFISKLPMSFQENINLKVRLLIDGIRK